MNRQTTWYIIETAVPRGERKFYFGGLNRGWRAKESDAYTFDTREEASEKLDRYWMDTPYWSNAKVTERGARV